MTPPPNLDTRLAQRLRTTPTAIAQLCDRWKIVELALFGSVLRDDFRPDSDIDLLIDFEPQHGWSLLDLVDLQEECEHLFDRPVDIVQRKNLTNPYRRQDILSTQQTLYVRD
ncbi:MAG: nucleotidyltransferase family protein [Geitlerinemataceae cyanobacterium]